MVVIKILIIRKKCSFVTLNNFYLFIDERERERETLISCSTYLYIHWLTLACALPGDQTHNLGASGQCSNQLKLLARANLYLFIVTDDVVIISQCIQVSPETNRMLYVNYTSITNFNNTKIKITSILCEGRESTKKLKYT